MSAVPQGPAWALAMFLAVLLKDAIHALIKRRNGNSSGKMGERLASLEAQPVLGERVAALEAALKSLNGGGAREMAVQLARLEAQVLENGREILRIRDWSHKVVSPQMTEMAGQLARLERDRRSP